MNRHSADPDLGTESANDSPGHGTPLVPQKLVKLARRLKAIRSNRDSIFDTSLFGEPAWDMMLALYIAEGEGFRLKISDLCNESGVPDTTALRWMDRLIELGMATRKPNPLDCRSNFIEMDTGTTRQMTAFLETVWERYFPIV